MDPISAICVGIFFPAATILTAGTALGVLSHSIYEKMFPPTPTIGFFGQLGGICSLLSAFGVLAVLLRKLMSDNCGGDFCNQCTRCNSGSHDVIQALSPRVRVTPSPRAVKAVTERETIPDYTAEVQVDRTDD